MSMANYGDGVTVTIISVQEPMISSQLSADAESFVPGLKPFEGNSETATATTIASGGQLPGFITNCYPFVSSHNDVTPARAPVAPAVPWTGPGRPPGGAVYPSQRWNAPPQNGAYAFTGGGRSLVGRGATMRGATPSFRQSPLPPHPALGAPLVPLMNSTPPQATPSVAAAPPPSAAASNAQQYPGYAFSTIPQQVGWPPAAATAPPSAYAEFRQYAGQPGYYAHWGDPERKPKKRKEAGNKVSIGIQNESGTVRADVLPKPKKVKPKTIILMDATNQTDFSDEVANLTLAEKPNSLYERRDAALARRCLHHAARDITSTTDSEEVDSDSGYSSPMHRRNLQNHGTHPAAAGARGAIPGGVPAVGAAPTGVTPGGKFLPEPPRAFIPPHLSDSFTSFSNMAAAANSGAVLASGYGQCHPLLPPPAQPSATLLAAPSVLNTNAAVSSLDFRHGSPSRGCTRTEPEDDELTSGLRKKKKKVKAKRKKNRSLCTEDVDALSDDPTGAGASGFLRTHSSSNVSSLDPLCADPQQPLHFEDEDEFPDLLTAAATLNPGALNSPTSPPVSTMAFVRSYSDILKTSSQTSPHGLQSPLSQESLHSGGELCPFGSGVNGSEMNLMTPAQQQAMQKETKTARKRRKRREMANRAAEEELAEISLEQQVLKEIGIKGSLGTAPPAPQPQQQQQSGKKSAQPINFNLADALKKQEESKRQKEQNGPYGNKLEKSAASTSNITAVVASNSGGGAGNVLDSSAPLQKRGKEREVPKQKKPSPLKKEREEKKRWRLMDGSECVEEESGTTGTGPVATDSLASASCSPLVPAERQVAVQALQAAGMVVPQDSDLSQEAASSCASSLNSMATGFGGDTPISASAELSPISQTSPISMSPLSPASPMNSGLTSPICNTRDAAAPSIALKIHSRRFREYCNQVLDKEIDNSCTLLLQELVRFQDRLYHKDPLKAKSKRRIVLGLREVSKHLKLHKIKCVIISPNLEKIQAKGGLDDALNNIIYMCQEQQVPFVFALGRRALGRACAKLVPVSVVGVFDYQGAQEHFQRLIDLTDKARRAYMEMVALLEKDAPDHAAQRYPQLFAHMGHSRTPSACSAISFSSSILSEPISENYPCSEPETDSRGYEIVRAADGEAVVVTTSHSAAASDAIASSGSNTVDIADALKDDPDKNVVVETLYDIDEYEADIEDINDTCTISNCNSQLSKSMSSAHTTSTNPSSSISSSKDSETSSKEVNGNEMEQENVEVDDEDEDNDDADQDDTVQDLPHIDSIHSSVVDLKAEILSQHSTTTIDSSRTVEAAPVNGVALDQQQRLRHRSGGGDDASTNNNASPTAKCARSLDKERIETWVAETQQQLETLLVNGESTSSPSNEVQTKPAHSNGHFSSHDSDKNL